MICIVPHFHRSEWQLRSMFIPTRLMVVFELTCNASGFGGGPLYIFVLVCAWGQNCYSCISQDMGFSSHMAHENDT